MPPLKNACKLITKAEIKQLMGRKPIVKRGGGPEGCVWTMSRAVYADIEQGGRNAEEAALR